MFRPCKHCGKSISWNMDSRAYFEKDDKKHACEEYFKARELKDKITAKSTDDLLLQILNELMAIRTILGNEKVR